MFEREECSKHFANEMLGQVFGHSPQTLVAKKFQKVRGESPYEA